MLINPALKLIFPNSIGIVLFLFAHIPVYIHSEQTILGYIIITFSSLLQIGHGLYSIYSIIYIIIIKFLK